MTNSWHERFSADEYVYGKEPNPFLAEAAAALPIGDVLCIAEGEGRNAVHLATLGHQVTTWDFAQAGLDKTKKLAEEKSVHVTTELRDLSTVVWEERKWDAIVHIFGHVPPEIMQRTWEGIRLALKPGGYYISELYTIEQLSYGTGGPKEKALLVNPVDELNAFEGFFIKHFFVGEVFRQEGLLHTGEAHVVQALLEKK